MTFLEKLEWVLIYGRSSPSMDRWVAVSIERYELSRLGGKEYAGWGLKEGDVVWDVTLPSNDHERCNGRPNGIECLGKTIEESLDRAHEHIVRRMRDELAREEGSAKQHSDRVARIQAQLDALSVSWAAAP